MTAPSNTIESFKLWLQSKNLSSSTVRNYVVDVNKYLNFSNSQNLYSEINLQQYISSISSDPNNSRYLASLNKFCQFALDQKIIKSNPIKKILHRRQSDSRPVHTTESLISQYQKHLIHKNFSQNTIKNYINDIHQFINWAEIEFK